MKLSIESAAGYHCPRWEELPSIPLYMDQVVMILQETLSLFEDTVVTTPAMINSYVKQKLIVPPEKKKYGKVQLTHLIIILLLKRVLSITEIQGLLQVSIQENTAEQDYNRFCVQFEKQLQGVFGGLAEPGLSKAEFGEADTGENDSSVMEYAISALVNKLCVQHLLEAHS